LSSVQFTASQLATLKVSRLLSGVLVVCAIGAAAFALTSMEAAVLAVVFLEQAFCLRYGFDRAIRQSAQGGPDFLAVFLSFRVIMKVFVAISVFDTRPDLDMNDILVLYQASIENQFWAEVIFLIGTVAFTIGWSMVSKPEAQSFSLVPQTRHLLIALPVSVVLWQLSARIDFLASSQIGGYFREAYLAIIFLLLIGKSAWAIDGARSWQTLLLLIPQLAGAAGWGSKEGLIHAVAPLILANLFKPSAKRMILFGTLGLLGFAIVTPLTNVIRQANWVGREEIELDQALSRLGSEYAEKGFFEVSTEGLRTFAARASSARNGAIVYGVATDRGELGFFNLRDALIALVPRFLWPDKPVIAPGAWFTYYLGRATSVESARTATAIPLATDFYWMFGWPSLVVGMFLLGALYARIWRLFHLLAQQSVAMAVGAAIWAFGGMKFEELNLIYALTGPVIFSVYMLSFWFAERFLGMGGGSGERRRRRRVRRRRPSLVARPTPAVHEP